MSRIRIRETPLIAVIGDDTAYLDVLCAFLADEGYEVMWVRSLYPNLRQSAGCEGVLAYYAIVVGGWLWNGLG